MQRFVVPKGRGNRAPYQTCSLRIPSTILPQVQSISDCYRRKVYESDTYFWLDPAKSNDLYQILDDCLHESQLSEIRAKLRSALALLDDL